MNRAVAPEELLPTCRSLAKDMLSCVPEMLRNMKRVIDEGFATTLSEGLKIEHEAWQARVRHVTPEAIAERRTSIQQRGRKQSS